MSIDKFIREARYAEGDLRLQGLNQHPYATAACAGAAVTRMPYSGRLPIDVCPSVAQRAKSPQLANRRRAVQEVCHRVRAVPCPASLARMRRAAPA
jgi:hypothetical protein